MRCPECGKPAEVRDKRDKSGYTRRRYLCFNDHRFSTIEQAHTFHSGNVEQIQESRERQILSKIKELLT